MIKLLYAVLFVSGNPSPLTVNTAAAGSQPNSATDTSTTYSTTPFISKTKITASLSSSLPANTQLTLTLAPPPGATSIPTSLTTTAQDVLTGLPSLVAANHLQITYQFQAPVKAGVISSNSVTVTLTQVTD